MVYYPFSNRRLTIDVFDEFKNESDLWGVFFEALVNHWYLLLIFTVMVVVLVVVAKATQVRLATTHKRFNLSFFISHTLFLIVGVLLIIPGLRGSFIYNTRPLAVTNAGQYTSKPNQVYLVTNTPFFLHKNI